VSAVVRKISTIIEKIEYSRKDRKKAEKVVPQR